MNCPCVSTLLDTRLNEISGSLELVLSVPTLRSNSLFLSCSSAGSASKRDDNKHGWSNRVDHTFCHRVGLVNYDFTKTCRKNSENILLLFQKEQVRHVRFSIWRYLRLIKVADKCASSPINKITPSAECRALESLNESSTVSLFARLLAPALLAAHGFVARARDSRLLIRTCSVFFRSSLRIFEPKRD